MGCPFLGTRGPRSLRPCTPLSCPPRPQGHLRSGANRFYTPAQASLHLSSSPFLPLLPNRRHGSPDQDLHLSPAVATVESTARDNMVSEGPLGCLCVRVTWTGTLLGAGARWSLASLARREREPSVPSTSSCILILAIRGTESGELVARGPQRERGMGA